MGGIHRAVRTLRRRRQQGWPVLLGGLILLLLLPAQPAAAQPMGRNNPPLLAPSRQISLRHLTFEQGLSSQYVTSVIQDQDGFMWFGTMNGLDRYDGYSIVVYRNEPTNPRSLSGNFISQVYEDHSGMLWVATRSGLNVFDRGSETFTRYLHDDANPQSLSNNAVRALYEDQSGGLWVGTNDGLNRFDRATGAFTVYRHDPANPQSLSNNVARVIYEDRSGGLWIGTGDGLDRFDPATGTFTVYRHDPANPQSLSNNSIFDVYQDRAGTLWVGTDGGGLNRFDPATGSFTALRHDPNNPHSLGDDRIDRIREDNTGALWVGTFSGGLSVLDPARRSFDVYQNDPASPASLSNNSVTDILQDRTGLMWLANYGGGVDIYNPQQQAYTVYRHDPQDLSSLASDTVSSLYEDRDGVLWIGTRDNGLDRFDRRTGQVVHYPADPANPQHLGHPYVAAIYQDHAGALWVGTYGGGLYRLDVPTGIFTAYRHDATRPDSLVDDRVRGIAEDATGTLWVATNGGLSRFDPQSGRITNYLYDAANPNTISSIFDKTVVAAAPHTLWIGTVGGGLNRLDTATGAVTRFQHDANDPNSLGDDNIADLHIDRAGVLWIGLAAGGLDRFDPAQGRFVHYREAEGLASDEVAAVLEDGAGGTPAGNLWIVTGHGITRLGTDRITVRAYGAHDGLPATQFISGLYAASDGTVLVGSYQGVIAFNPDRLPEDTTPPPVAFTDLLLDNKPVPIGASSPLTQAINRIDTIDIPYGSRIISFGFAALSYRTPAQNRYRYKLDGFGADWIEVDSSRRLATYTNLEPGRYVFHVTASNADGVWNPTGRTITLLIEPPWWQTLWFRALVVLAAGGLLFAAYRWRTGNLRRQQTRLEAAVDARTRELAQANQSLGFQAQLLDIVQNSVIAVDRNEQVIYANAHAERMYGWPVAEMIGQKISQFHLTELAAEERTAIFEQMLQGQSWTGERTARRRDGSHFAMLVANSPIRDEEGQLTGFVGVSTDITARKRAEEAVQQVNLVLLQRLEELSTLNGIAETLGTVADLPEALGIVGRTLLRVLDAGGISFCILDATCTSLRPLANSGQVLVPLQEVGSTVPLAGVPFAERAVAQQGVVMGTPDHPAGAAAGQESVPVTYLMLIPLRARGETVGLLVVVSTVPGKTYTPAQVALAVTIAGSAATAIETGRLFAEERRQRQTAESLREVVAALSSNLDADTVFQRVLVQLRRVLAFDAAAIWLVDGDALALADSVGVNGRAPYLRLALTGDLPHIRVWRQERGALIPEITAGERWPGLPDAAHSWMGAPLRTDTQTIGIMGVAHHTAGAYRPADLATLEVFAAQAAVAIDNASRYRRAHGEGVDEERQRLARELHDSVTQALFSAGLVADVLPLIWARSPSEAEETLGTLRRLTRGALAEMRTLLLELRPDALTQVQLHTAVENLITAIASQQPLDVSQRLDHAPPLPAEVQGALYRMIQEALNNIVKHAQATMVRVELTVAPPVSAPAAGEWHGQITISIADNGVGFDPASVSADHLGLRIMSERAAAIGAVLHIDSSPDNGTELTIRWSDLGPLPENTDG